MARDVTPAATASAGTRVAAQVGRPTAVEPVVPTAASVAGTARGGTSAEAASAAMTVVPAAAEETARPTAVRAVPTAGFRGGDRAGAGASTAATAGAGMTGVPAATEVRARPMARAVPIAVSAAATGRLRVARAVSSGPVSAPTTGAPVVTGTADGPSVATGVRGGDRDSGRSFGGGDRRPGGDRDSGRSFGGDRRPSGDRDSGRSFGGDRRPGGDRGFERRPTGTQTAATTGSADREAGYGRDGDDRRPTSYRSGQDGPARSGQAVVRPAGQR